MFQINSTDMMYGQSAGLGSPRRLQRARGADAVAAQSRLLVDLVTRFFAAFLITMNVEAHSETTTSKASSGPTDANSRRPVDSLCANSPDAT